MGIDIRKFVDVNVTHSTQPSSISIRDTAVLITSEGAANKVNTFSSLLEWQDYTAANSSLSFTNTTKYVKAFFANGGIRLRIYEASTDSIITELEDNLIVVAVVGMTMSDAKSLASTLDSSLEGLHRKILLARAKNSDISTNPEVQGLNCLAVKYSEIEGAEMAIAAYLTRIKIEGDNTVHDYAFTSESINEDVSVVIDDALFDKLQSYNFNFNLTLSGANRNIGGNMASGYSLVNEYMLIVLHQTVSEQLLALLVTKIKGNKALSSIRTVLSQEMNTYVRNGYLATNKTWSNETWTEVHNGTEYTIIEKNTPIGLGYYIQVLPWIAVNNLDMAAGQAPPVYIVIADSSGVRKLTVTGEVV